MASHPRVAIVTGMLKLGGSSIFVHNLGLELIQRGLPVVIISGEADYRLDPTLQQSLRPVLLNDRSVIFEDRVEQALSHLRAFEPDVVIANLGHFSFEILRYLPDGISRIAMVHSDDPNVYRSLTPYAPYIDTIVGVSRKIVRRLQEISAFSRIHKTCVPCGIPMPANVRRTPRKNSELRILYLGRLDREQKRVDRLPLVAEKLQNSGRNFQWTFAGDGPNRLQLEKQMKQLAPNVRPTFHGAVEYAKIGSIIEEHDVFVLVSDFEGLPLSLVEAMAYGLVPVVTDLESGVRDVVDSTTGYLVRSDDIDGYAAAILWLDEHRDELEAKSNAASNRVAQEFSAKAMLERWLPLLPPHAVSAKWPARFNISGVLNDSWWKFLPFVRQARRFLKQRSRGSATI